MKTQFEFKSVKSFKSKQRLLCTKRRSSKKLFVPYKGMKNTKYFCAQIFVNFLKKI